MALQDIFNAIIEDADRRIADAQALHREKVKQVRDSADRIKLDKQKRINEQRDQKKRQLKEKTESHARMRRSKIILGKKQEYMNKIYSSVLVSLINLPKGQAEMLIQKFLATINEEGVIHASPAHEALVKKHLPAGCTLGKSIDSVGGFRFVSDKHEQDFTFEFLVSGLLRPATEVRVASQIFPAL